MTKTVVIALGGNAMIQSGQKGTVEEQFENTVKTCRFLAPLAQKYNLIITHGNGPQVGFILRRSDIASKELHEVPLVSCVADTQGALGYMIQQALSNEFHKLNIPKEVVTIVTQVLVDKKDPAFTNPTKPIGSFMDLATAEKRKQEQGWNVVEDAGRGWRRVVASPEPKEILELDSVRKLAAAGKIVIAAGGGGIPVIKNDAGLLEGIAAVIDKDKASAVLAAKLGAEILIILTGIDKVAINYRKPNQQDLDVISVEDAQKYLREGHFPDGNMGPKIEAAIDFLKHGGKEVIITNPFKINEALDGKTGTKILSK